MVIRKYPKRGLYIYTTFKDLGYTIPAFADVLGVDYRQVHRWVSNNGGMRIQNLKLICDGLERISGVSWEVYAVEILKR